MFMKATEIIVSFKESSGLSVNELMQRAGIKSRTPYYNMISGRKPVSLTIIDKMLRVCGYTLTPTPISEVETPNNEPEEVNHLMETETAVQHKGRKGECCGVDHRLPMPGVLGETAQRIGNGRHPRV